MKERLIELDQPPIIERAVLVRLVLPRDSDEEVEESLEEMRQLAWTAGADVACTIIQRRPKPSPGTLIGEGKISEIKTICDELEVDIVIFDTDLTPTQGSRLEKLIECKVVDRTQLILDIFAQRAQTNEGKHQVELAQLQYQLPRLAGRGSIMRQQGGIGVRGPGEQKLEVDRRVIRRRIERLQNEIDSIRKNRRVQRKRRKDANANTVALVGYTNAGKSSLLKSLSGSDIFVENKLFATLDPTARRCTLPGEREAVFIDTVGFIRKLPHTLVAAFRATLEEVNEADMILLVADAAHPAVEDHIHAVYQILEEIGARDKPIITVFNKTDIADPAKVEQLGWRKGQSVAVSAHTREGLNDLLEAVERHLSLRTHCVSLQIPQDKAGIVARIHELGRVIDQKYVGNEIILEAEINESLEGQVSRYIIRKSKP